MSHSVFDMIDAFLKEPVPLSWHEAARRDLGIPDECANEALLCITLECGLDDLKSQPLAFVVDSKHLANTMTALTEFLREAMHPTYGGQDVLAVVDFLPPIDDFGTANGISRRWVLDRFNYGLMLPAVSSYLRTLARGL